MPPTVGTFLQCLVSIGIGQRFHRLPCRVARLIHGQYLDRDLVGHIIVTVGEMDVLSAEYIVAHEDIEGLAGLQFICIRHFSPGQILSADAELDLTFDDLHTLVGATDHHT